MGLTFAVGFWEIITKALEHARKSNCDLWWPLGHITWLQEGLETEVRHVGNVPMGSDKNSGY